MRRGRQGGPRSPSGSSSEGPCNELRRVRWGGGADLSPDEDGGRGLGRWRAAGPAADGRERDDWAPSSRHLRGGGTRGSPRTGTARWTPPPAPLQRRRTTPHRGPPQSPETDEIETESDATCRRSWGPSGARPSAAQPPPLSPAPKSCLKGSRAAAAAPAPQRRSPPPLARGARRGSQSPPAQQRRSGYSAPRHRSAAAHSPARGGAAGRLAPPANWAAARAPRTPPDRRRALQLSSDSMLLELSPPTATESAASPGAGVPPPSPPPLSPPPAAPRGRLSPRRPRAPPRGALADGAREEEQRRGLMQRREEEYRTMHVRRLLRSVTRLAIHAQARGDGASAAALAEAAALRQQAEGQAAQLRGERDRALQRQRELSAQVAEQAAAATELRAKLAAAERERGALRREAEGAAAGAAAELRKLRDELEEARGQLRSARDDARRRALVEGALQDQLVRESSDRRRLDAELAQLRGALPPAEERAERAESERDAALAAARAATSSAAEADAAHAAALQQAEERGRATEGELRALRAELAHERAARAQAERQERQAAADGEARCAALAERLRRAEASGSAALDMGLAEAERVLQEGEREAVRLEERAVLAERRLEEEQERRPTAPARSGARRSLLADLAVSDAAPQPPAQRGCGHPTAEQQQQQQQRGCGLPAAEEDLTGGCPGRAPSQQHDAPGGRRAQHWGWGPAEHGAGVARGEQRTPCSHHQGPPCGCSSPRCGCSRCSPTPGCSQCPLSSPGRRSQAAAAHAERPPSSGSCSPSSAASAAQSDRLTHSALRSLSAPQCARCRPAHLSVCSHCCSGADPGPPVTPTPLHSPPAGGAGRRVLLDLTNTTPAEKQKPRQRSSEVQHSFQGFRLMVDDIRRRHLPHSRRPAPEGAGGAGCCHHHQGGGGAPGCQHHQQGAERSPRTPLWRRHPPAAPGAPASPSPLSSCELSSLFCGDGLPSTAPEG
eukprot:TRINITY_DN7424_c1_g1_i1.p1 TRINITY_DN7424_c1_g1~~TRINITY_DN7424_c1_g1_i1.p1  ORF type:complete len:987 (+),score=242.06 TRINITY_DN7424_c1_g1_i1:74-2962(+)